MSQTVGTHEIERRYVAAPVRKEVRQEGEETEIYISGIAAKVNETTSLGFMRERIAPGAFDEVLNSPDLDCLALFNHDANLILARRSSVAQSLELSLTEEGHLAYRFKVPSRSYARDLADAIQAGDVTQSSFAFRVDSVTWDWDDEDPSQDLRTINSISELLDVSPVTYPAYQNTLTEASPAERQHQEARSQFGPSAKSGSGRGQESSSHQSLIDEYDARYMLNRNNQNR